MNVSYSKELTHGFVATPENLKDIVILLEEHVGAVDIHADCKDDISRNFDSVEELIAYRNPKSKALYRVYFYARSDDRLITARIRFLDSIWTGVLIDLTGPEDVVTKIKEETQDIISGMRPWYSVVSFPVVSITFGCIYGIITAFWIQTALGYEWGKIGLIKYLREVFPLHLILAIISVPLWLLLKKPYMYLFPNAVFRIGQGNSRFEIQQKVRWCVIIGFFVSLAAGVFVLILQLNLK